MFIEGVNVLIFCQQNHRKYRIWSFKDDFHRDIDPPIFILLKDPIHPLLDGVLKALINFPLLEPLIVQRKPDVDLEIAFLDKIRRGGSPSPQFKT